MCSVSRLATSFLAFSSLVSRDATLFDAFSKLCSKHESMHRLQDLQAAGLPTHQAVCLACIAITVDAFYLQQCQPLTIGQQAQMDTTVLNGSQICRVSTSTHKFLQLWNPISGSCLFVMVVCDWGLPGMQGMLTTWPVGFVIFPKSQSSQIMLEPPRCSACLHACILLPKHSTSKVLPVRSVP